MFVVISVCVVAFVCEQFTRRSPNPLTQPPLGQVRCDGGPPPWQHATKCRRHHYLTPIACTLFILLQAFTLLG